MSLSGGSYRASEVSLGSCSIVLQEVESASLELYGYFSTARSLTSLSPSHHPLLGTRSFLIGSKKKEVGGG